MKLWRNLKDIILAFYLPKGYYLISFPKTGRTWLMYMLESTMNRLDEELILNIESFLKIFTLLPLGAHKSGLESLPNNTTILADPLEHSLIRCIGPVSLPIANLHNLDISASSARLVCPTKFITFGLIA